jgi:hypothetical protein
MPLVAIVVTSFRLYCRVRQGRLWTDDLWAALAMILVLGLLVVDWLYLQDYGEPLIACFRDIPLIKDAQEISLKVQG